MKFDHFKVPMALKMNRNFCFAMGFYARVYGNYNGKWKCSALIESQGERLDSHKLRTTANHPQTDGIIERFNRTIKTMLTQIVHDHKQDDWDLMLGKLSFAYNTAVHAIIKFLPFELMFGRIPKFLIDLLYDQTDSDELWAKIDVEWIASDLDHQKKEMKAIFDFAAVNRDVER